MSAYAPKKIAIVNLVKPGHSQARTPKMTAAIPRINHVHQLRVRVSTIEKLRMALLNDPAIGQHHALHGAKLRSRSLPGLADECIGKIVVDLRALRE